MRFKRKHEIGETFIKETFALLPIGIKGEWRWLERIKIECHYFWGPLGVDISYHKFVD